MNEILYRSHGLSGFVLSQPCKDSIVLFAKNYYAIFAQNWAVVARVLGWAGELEIFYSCRTEDGC